MDNFLNIHSIYIKVSALCIISGHTSKMSSRLEQFEMLDDLLSVTMANTIPLIS